MLLRLGQPMLVLGDAVFQICDSCGVLFALGSSVSAYVIGVRRMDIALAFCDGEGIDIETCA